MAQAPPLTAAPSPSEQWSLTGAYEFKGIKATGQAWVYYGKGNASLTNPVIIAEGFPGGQTLDQLWTTFNRSNFASSLLSLGFDLILLGYIAPTPNVPTYIEANAAVAIACIQQAVSKTPKASLAVGGASMGGLITRYALAYMEQNNIPHNTSLYFSFDTPHLGANIPASVLYFVNFVAYKDPHNQKIQAIYNMLQSPAAQEMLLYSLGPYQPENWEPGVSQLRTTFLENLAGLGNHGFPAKPYLLGVSNGDGTGAPNTTPPGAAAFAWNWDTFHILSKLYSAAGGTNGLALQFQAEKSQYEFDWDYNVDGNPGVQYDSAPGGRGDFFQVLNDALQGIGSPQLYYGQSCFIPTISALAMSTLDPNKQADLYLDLAAADPVPPSLLASYLYSNENSPHVTFTPQLSQWLLGQILLHGPQLANGLPG